MLDIGILGMLGVVTARVPYWRVGRTAAESMKRIRLAVSSIILKEMEEGVLTTSPVFGCGSRNGGRSADDIAPFQLCDSRD